MAQKHGFRDYNDYLFSSHWRNLKKSLGMFACCVCESSKNLLAHHVRYRDLIDVEVSDLVCMCFACHDIFHIGCRKSGRWYVGIESSEIKSLVKAFLLEPWCVKRSDALKRRCDIRKDRKSKPKRETRRQRKKRLKMRQRHPQRRAYVRRERRDGNFIISCGKLIYSPRI